MALGGQKPTQHYWESSRFTGTCTLWSKQKEAQHKDTEPLCGSAGDRQSGPGRFLIGVELKLQGEKTQLCFGLKKGAGGIVEKSPSSFYDNWHSKNLHHNLT